MDLIRTEQRQTMYYLQGQGCVTRMVDVQVRVAAPKDRGDHWYSAPVDAEDFPKLATCNEMGTHAIIGPPAHFMFKREGDRVWTIGIAPYNELVVRIKALKQYRWIKLHETEGMCTWALDSPEVATFTSSMPWSIIENKLS